MAGVKLCLCKSSFDGLPIESKVREALNRILSSLSGEVVEILPRESCSFDVEGCLTRAPPQSVQIRDHPQ